MSRIKLDPTSGAERIISLDIIRALALFGVLWMNFADFSGARVLETLGHPVGHGWLDALVRGAGAVLVKEKSASVFSMLFGIGLFIQFERAQAKGLGPASFAFRRLGGLFLIGFLHWVLIWNGDILTGYALVGCCLPLLLKARPRTFIFVALLALAFSDAIPILIKLLHLPAGLNPFVGEEARARVIDAVLGHGTWMTCLKLRLFKMFSIEGAVAFLVTFPWALPMFLVGAWLWRLGLPQDPMSRASLLKRLFHGTIWLGLLCSFLARDPFNLFSKAWKQAVEGSLWLYFTDIGTYFLAIGYCVGLLRLLAKPNWAGRFAFFAPMGRMALTNYLSQSLVFTWIFYHYGLGLWGKVRPSVALIVVVTFYALQVAWSHWWLTRFKFGPAEWLWRSMT